MDIIYRKANQQDKSSTLKCIDRFNDFANKKSLSSKSNFAQTNSGDLFLNILNSDLSEIFIALDNTEVIGVIEVHKVFRLYSGFDLKQAHKFYEQAEFVHAGKTYKYILD